MEQVDQCQLALVLGQQLGCHKFKPATKGNLVSETIKQTIKQNSSINHNVNKLLEGSNAYYLLFYLHTK